MVSRRQANFNGDQDEVLIHGDSLEAITNEQINVDQFSSPIGNMHNQHSMSFQETPGAESQAFQKLNTPTHKRLTFI